MKKKILSVITIFLISIFTITGCNDSSSTTEATSTDATMSDATTTNAELSQITDEDSVTTTEDIITTTEITTEISSINDSSNSSDSNTSTTEAATTESTTQSTTETTTEATTEHVHNWVAQYDTIHHDAVTEEVEVTKEVPIEKEMCVSRCKSCGWTEVPPDLPTGTYSEHVDAMGTEIIILWGEEHEVDVCRDGCQTVPYEYTVYETVTVTEVQIISEAYDEKVLKGYYCNECSQWQ